MNHLNGYGKCPACGAWNTFYEEKITKDKNTGNYKKIESSEMVKLNDVEVHTYTRYKTNFAELDRVLRRRISTRLFNITWRRAWNRQINFNFADM